MPRRRSLAALACIAPFVVSGAWTLQRLGHEGRLGAIDPGSFFWNAVVLRHQIWALVALTVVLCLALRDGSVRAEKESLRPSVR